MAWGMNCIFRIKWKNKKKCCKEYFIELSLFASIWMISICFFFVSFRYRRKRFVMKWNNIVKLTSWSLQWTRSKLWWKFFQFWLLNGPIYEQFTEQTEFRFCLIKLSCNVSKCIYFQQWQHSRLKKEIFIMFNVIFITWTFCKYYTTQFIFALDTILAGYGSVLVGQMRRSKGFLISPFFLYISLSFTMDVLISFHS